MPAKQHMDNPNAKRILIVCDEGNNRSVTIAGQLKYWGHDCITVGLNRNDETTLHMLAKWADLIIAVSEDVALRFHPYPNSDDLNKIQLWDIGEDKYPRPYNKELLTEVKKHIEQHRDELAPVKS